MRSLIQAALKQIARGTGHEQIIILYCKILRGKWQLIQLAIHVLN